MTELSFDFLVAASADAVWEVVGRRFDQIGSWATAIPASAAAAPATAQSSPLVTVPGTAGVTGRVCQTGVRGVPQVTERLVAYDDAGRTLTYEADGMPSFVALARNTWTVTSAGPDQARVSLRASFETRGPLGWLGKRVILMQAAKTSRHLADDLRHYVQTGAPSPRKQRQLDRAQETAT